MPLERRRCDECGTEEPVCPECGSKKVTPRDNPHQKSPNALVDYGTDHRDEPYTQQYTHVCWDCGWSEERIVTVETL